MREIELLPLAGNLTSLLASRFNVARDDDDDDIVNDADVPFVVAFDDDDDAFAFDESSASTADGAS